MFFINPTKKPTRPQLISGSIWPRERKKRRSTTKNFFWRKRKKIGGDSKKERRRKKTISGFCSKARKKFGTYKKVEIDFLQIGYSDLKDINFMR